MISNAGPRLNMAQDRQTRPMGFPCNRPALSLLCAVGNDRHCGVSLKLPQQETGSLCLVVFPLSVSRYFPHMALTHLGGAPEHRL